MTAAWRNDIFSVDNIRIPLCWFVFHPAIGLHVLWRRFATETVPKITPDFTRPVFDPDSITISHFVRGQNTIWIMLKLKSWTFWQNNDKNCVIFEYKHFIYTNFECQLVPGVVSRFRFEQNNKLCDICIELVKACSHSPGNPCYGSSVDLAFSYQPRLTSARPMFTQQRAFKRYC